MLLDRPLINMVITTCRRLDYFIKTMDSVYDNLTDIDLLGKITICDDHSSEEDRQVMREKYPDVEFIYPDKPGHHHAIQFIYARLNSDFILQWEDDFYMTKGPHISRALEIFQNHPDVGSVVLMPCDGEKHSDKYGDYFIKQYNHAERDLYDRATGYTPKLGKPLWPGWSTNSSIQRTEPLKKLKYPSCKNHEFTFSLAYHNAGYRVAYVDKWVSQHFGKDVSAYDLNGTMR